MADVEGLRAHLAKVGRVLLGYSGGVDSAFLAVVARDAVGRNDFLAAIGRSASYPETQYQTALSVARRFDLPLFELETGELSDRRYLANATDRCYFCKAELWSRLGGIARERDFDAIVDGTNADDLNEHRPGLRAAAEHGVRSPLAELGWTKSDIRSASRALGLETWDAPAAPCLSSRVQYGVTITVKRLQQVEAGEAYLRSIGVTGDLRVRHDGVGARVEVAPIHFGRLRGAWDEIIHVFDVLGFAAVELDARGYRRGSLLTVIGQPAP